MGLRKEIEQSLRREDTEVDAVEDYVMKDSVLEMASADFKEQDVLDLPLTTRKQLGTDVRVDYPGKPVSRKKYSKDVGGAQDSDFEEEDGGSGDEVDSDDAEQSFMKTADESSGDDEQEDEEDQEGEESEGEEDMDDEEVDTDGSQSEGENKGLDQDENDGNEGMSSMKMFSSSSVESTEIQKGLAVREQLRICESLLENRIKFEPGLVAANQLYQYNKMQAFISGEKSKGSLDIDSAFTALQDLSSSWSKLQEALGGQSNQKPSLKRKSNKINEGSINDSDNESIRSSEASEKLSEEDVSDVESDTEEPPIKKPKPQQPLTLDQSYAAFAPFRDAELTKWNEKAKISSGRAAQKDFSAFDQSILKLIESILFDKYRLIRKTQLKRSDYVIYGKSELEEKEEEDVEQEDGGLVVNKSQNKKDHVYDPEIFDDGDFYQKLLRDFIEGKSSDSGISKQERKLMELHRLRIKMKRKIDTRATKGRKLRYVVHPKLVNYMAPVPSNSFSAEAETQLLKSLFGQTLATSA